MSITGHLRIFMQATLVWGGFWIAGLPYYYRQYPAALMVWLETALLSLLIWLVHYILKQTPGKYRIRKSLWLAFYYTIPLAVYDWLYCGIYLGHGLGFIRVYWYLTIYYIVPWPLLYGVAVHLNCLESRPQGT
ncbi:MAG: hypothetical protein FIA91_08990 [Geobacter sp.]|nr:hypothetical protein [Geobacter sp.]